MKIISEDKKSEVLIESCCPEPACYPSVCVNLQLKTQEVSGKQNGVLISEDALTSFLHQLKTFDGAGKGTPTLCALTRDGFTMTLFALDSLGHIGLRATLQGRKLRAGGKFFEFSVEAAFEIDATSIPKITSGFRELIDQQKESAH